MSLMGKPPEWAQEGERGIFTGDGKPKNGTQMYADIRRSKNLSALISVHLCPIPSTSGHLFRHFTWEMNPLCTGMEIFLRVCW